MNPRRENVAGSQGRQGRQGQQTASARQLQFAMSLPDGRQGLQTRSDYVMSKFAARGLAITQDQAQTIDQLGVDFMVTMGQPYFYTKFINAVIWLATVK